MTYKISLTDDTIFRVILCEKSYPDPENQKNCSYFPFIENEYTWAELNEKRHPLYGFVQQVLKEEREKISLEAEKQASKLILETN